MCFWGLVSLRAVRVALLVWLLEVLPVGLRAASFCLPGGAVALSEGARSLCPVAPAQAGGLAPWQCSLPMLHPLAPVAC